MPKTSLTNTELVESLGLPEDIIDKLATAQGEEYQAAKNEFITNLVNKIVYSKVSRMSFKNPFKKYDSYPVKFGDTIENIFVELPKGYKFDKDATDPFTKANPSVKTLYATINYEMQYEVTIQDVLLRRAALSEFGFMQLIEYMLSTLETKMNVDEYDATLTMLNNADLFADGFEELDVSGEATTTDKYKAVADKIIEVVDDYEIPSTDNNALKVMNTTPRDRVLLIIKQDVLRHINLDYLAGVFNLSKVDLVKNIIKVRSFQTIQDNGEGEEPTVHGEDIDFMVIDEDGFDNHTALQDSGLIYNPKGKYTNHFTNLWKIISFKYFHNARAFKLKLEAGE